MTLGDAVGGMFKTYIKKPLLFSGIYVIVMLPVIFLQIFVISQTLSYAMLSGDLGVLMGVGGLLLLLFIVVSFVAGVLTLGGIIRAASKVLSGSDAKIGECLQYAFKKIGAYIVLALRVFVYTLVWLLILWALLGPLSMALFQTSLVEALGFLYFVGFIVIAVITIIRSLKAVFSFYILFGEENMSSKDALKKSIEITKGRLWRIIGYGIVLAIIISFFVYVLEYLTSAILEAIAYGIAYTITSTVLALIFGGLLTPLPVLFYFIFYKGLAHEKKAA